MSSENPSRRFFLVLLIAATILVGSILRPLASALFLAAVLAGILWPFQQKLAARLRGRRSLSAGVLLLAVVVLLVGPIAGLSAVVVKEGSDGWKFVSSTVRSEGVAGVLQRLPASVARLVKQGLDRLPQEPGESIEETVGKQVSAQGGNAAAAAGAAVAATGSFLFQAAMMLIALFFLLIHGDDLVAFLDDAAPLKRGQTRELLGEFKKVSVAVVVSSVITSGVQALTALAGYLIAGVPRPIFFAAATFFLALVPAIGGAAVCVAAAAFLFLTGHPYMAIFLALWGVGVVGLVDNIVKPLLIRGGMEMDGAVVFFSLVGGLGAFGPIGLLAGPLVVSLFLALLRIYRRDFAAVA